jgi:L-amino acid N-acyltransferase YncA
MEPPTIRLATAEDLAAINAIYNHYVCRSTCTYQEEPTTEDERREWFAAHGARHPVTVAVIDGAVVGWGALSVFRSRAAYLYTVEDSVYVRPDMQRRGIGKAILADLIVRAQALGHHAVMALIDGEQGPSIALHERFGFARVGLLKEVGCKFSRWLDVVYMERLV